MTKKIFLAFTAVMVTISGICIHTIVSRAKLQLAKSLRNQTQVPVKNDNEATVTVPPSPTKTKSQDDKTVKTGTSLTKKQRYYTGVADPDSVNILLIGKDPTYANHDILIIASISEEDKTVKLIDIPRDIYVDYSSDILKKLKKTAPDFYSEKGSMKINAAHVVGKMINYSPAEARFPGKPGMNFLADLIKEIFDVEIDDYIAVETDGFREIVDFFGGVVINVPIYMHYEDPAQGLYIHLEPGVQLLDGRKAEGFVRFRQGYNTKGEYISYPRSKNIYLFLKSFFEQHFNLKNLAKIGKVYEIIKKNTETSVGDISETYEYAVLAKKIIDENYSIENISIETSGKKTYNGALYELLKTK